MKTPKANELFCVKARGGKNALWHAYRIYSEPSQKKVVGAGNSADNAIKDYQKQFRRFHKGT